MFFIMSPYHLADFVQWPLRAVLLWDGCDRANQKASRSTHLS